MWLNSRVVCQDNKYGDKGIVECEYYTIIFCQKGGSGFITRALQYLLEEPKDRNCKLASQGTERTKKAIRIPDSSLVSFCPHSHFGFSLVCFLQSSFLSSLQIKNIPKRNATPYICTTSEVTLMSN